MTMRIVWVLSILCIATLVRADDAALLEKIKVLEAENAALKIENAQLKAKLQSLTGEVTQLSEKVTTLQSEKQELAAQNFGPTRDQLLASERSRLQQKPASGDQPALTSTIPSRLKIDTGSRAEHHMTLSLASGTPNASVQWNIRTFFSNGAYRGMRELPLNIDGQIVTLTITHNENKITSNPGERGAVQSDEYLTIDIPPAVLEQMSKATKVRGSIRKTEFTLQPAQIAQFELMRELRQP